MARIVVAKEKQSSPGDVLADVGRGLRRFLIVRDHYRARLVLDFDEETWVHEFTAGRFLRAVAVEVRQHIGGRGVDPA